MILLKKFTLIIFILSCVISYAQIFSWKNPNTYFDSIRQDSLIRTKIQRDFYSLDTLAIIHSSKTVPELNEILVKNDKSKILGGLNAKGSVIRGVTFGNNQGSSVQSSMEMQITGKLSDDVSILASISDHNLPIQADGYTQTLEEFDKVYMQLNIRNSTILRAGHLDLNNNHTYFGRYQRRSMGLEFLTALGKQRTTTLNIAGGVARSEFHRMRFQGIEGNQGPYRLTGQNGENFITIISGSEQVYIDGILMKRGENLDYIINYNTGEITFTSFRPIYRQNFISVSYNYTNRNYARYLVTGGLHHRSERWKLAMDWFLENDSKNAPLSLNLSKEDQMQLALAGNNPAKMYAPSGIASEYDANKILYKLVNGIHGPYYEFSTDSAQSLYQVSFTYFGSGRGDYLLKQTTNNGRLFEYAGPGQGEYAAARKLPAPKKTNMLSANAEYALTDGRIGTDISVVNHDANLFSSIDNGRNIGYAARLFGNKIFRKNHWKGAAEAEYQHIDRNFYVLDRINDVEFARDFNLGQEFRQITQDRAIFSMLNTWKNGSYLNYRSNFLNEKNSYRGFKNDLDFGWQMNSFRTLGKVSYLNTKSPDLHTRFARGHIISEHLGRKGSWGLGGALEHNVKKLNKTDTFDATSFSWKEIFIQKRIGDSLRTKLFAKAYLRDNDSVRNNKLVNVNHIVGLMAESQLIRSEKTTLNTLLHYRKFFYQDQSFATGDNQDFLVGNIVFNQQLFQNGMRIQAFYELGNGQEPQREFQYVKVTDGQGVYKWTDYNADGVQQLDEFETAEYADLAQYIRIYTNSFSYIPSNKNKLQLAVFMNPAVVFRSENAFLKRWNFNVSLQSQNSYYKKDRVVMLNPFRKEPDQILKNQNLLFSAQFNPTEKSGWNGSYRFTDTDNLVNANFSIEENRRRMHIFNAGYWFSKQLRADWENALSDTYNHSQLFASRNYQLKNVESRPKVTYRFSENLQSEVTAALRNKNRVDGEERLKAFEVTGGLQWDYRKTSIRGNFSFINNDFKGTSFSIVGNQMLDGLKPGKNQVWSAYIQQALNSFVTLNANYEGRNSGERVIHIGSVQLKASF